MNAQIDYGKHESFYFIRMVGAIRFVNCQGFQQWIALLKSAPDWQRIVVDLLQVTHIDSTGLGLVAACVVCSERLGRAKPLVLVRHPDIITLLHAMRFEQNCEIRDPGMDWESANWQTAPEQSLDFPVNGLDQTQLASDTLAAHQFLVEMDPRNETLFRDVITQLDGELRSKESLEKIERGRG